MNEHGPPAPPHTMLENVGRYDNEGTQVNGSNITAARDIHFSSSPISTTISSHSRVIQGELHGDLIQGDVYIKQSGLLEGDRRREWERRQEEKKRQEAREEQERLIKSLRVALDFKGKTSRVQQLNLTQVPIQSFDWVWSDRIPLTRWLQGSGPFLWLRGKPGSGKSTLINYLAKSGRTHELLNEIWYWSKEQAARFPGQARSRVHKYVTMAFFFDLRAGTSAANDLIGLVKNFLAVLANNDEVLEKELACENAKKSFADAEITIFAGLDEYKGSHTHLANSLMQIQDRGNIKMLLSSRPEPAFVTAFRHLPQIQMQDHNEESIRIYIDDAVSRGRETMFRIDSIIDDNIRQEILRRAEGVIIWARLAVDELIRAASVNKSKHEMRKVLELLPRELEQMYDLILLRHSALQRTEASLVLCLINLLGGTANTNLLRGAWDFCHHFLPDSEMVDIRMDKRVFEIHMTTLLGSFIDRIITNDVDELRLMHRTLATYLCYSKTIEKSLPAEFQALYPVNDPSKFYMGVIDAAADSKVLQFDDVVSLAVTKMPVNDRLTAFRLAFESDKVWQLRSFLLQHSLMGTIGLAETMDNTEIEPDDSIRTAFSSYLMIITSRCATEINWNFGQKHGMIDLFLAVENGFESYVRERLTGFTALKPQEWLELFHTSLKTAMQTGDTHLNTNILRLAESIGQHVTVLHPDTMRLCSRIASISDPDIVGHRVYKPLVVNLLETLRLSPSNQHVLNRETSHDFDENTNLYLWWLQEGRHSPLNNKFFDLIVTACPDVNAGCDGGEGPLHVLLNECNHAHAAVDCPLRFFVTFVKLGVDPRVEAEGLSVLDLARTLSTSPRIMTRRFMKRGIMHACDFSSVIKAFEFYNINGCWPDLRRNRLNTIRADVWWPAPGQR